MKLNVIASLSDIITVRYRSRRFTTNQSANFQLPVIGRPIQTLLVMKMKRTTFAINHCHWKQKYVHNSSSQIISLSELKKTPKTQKLRVYNTMLKVQWRAEKSHEFISNIARVQRTFIKGKLWKHSTYINAMRKLEFGTIVPNVL